MELEQLQKEINENVTENKLQKDHTKIIQEEQSLQKLQRDNKSRNNQNLLSITTQQINQTVKEQATKGFNQLLQSNNPMETMRQFSNVKSTTSGGISEAFRSQRSGGASSSKKVIMQKVNPKKQTHDNNYENNDDDNDENIRDPELDDGSPKRRLQDPRNDRQSASTQFSKSPTTFKSHNDQIQPPSSFVNNLMQGNYYPNPIFLYSPLTQFSSYGQTQLVQQQMHTNPPSYMHYPPYITPPLYDPYMMDQFSKQKTLNDDLIFDEIDPDFQQQQQQFIPDYLSMIVEEQTMLAIVVEDTCCQLKGELLQLYEGDQVEIVKIIQDMGVAECKFQNQLGVFPLNSLKIRKRAQFTKRTTDKSQPSQNSQSNTNNIKRQSIESNSLQSVMHPKPKVEKTKRKSFFHEQNSKELNETQQMKNVKIQSQGLKHQERQQKKRREKSSVQVKKKESEDTLMAALNFM